MKKEILLLATPANTGKTTTINVLYEEFIKNYKLEDKKEPVFDRDFRAFHNDNEPCLNGHRVVFASAGDDRDTVKNNCEFFSESKCTICITACRAKGVTKNTILEFAKENSMNISFFDFIGNNLNDNEKFETTNGEKARMMLSRVKYLINLRNYPFSS